MSPFACAFLIVLISFSLLNNYNVDCAKQKLPKFVKQCHISGSDEELQKCMRENIVIFKPRLGPGIPEMKIPGLDPFHMERIVIDAPNTRFEFGNVVISGATNFEVESADIDVKNSRLAMDVLFESIYLESTYAVKGKLLILELETKGDAKGNFSNIFVHIELIAKERLANGQTFLDFTDDSKNSVEIKLKEKPSIYFSNLSANNEELTRVMHQVIDDNIEEIFAEWMPVVNKIIGQFVFDTIKQIFNTFSIEDLFLP